LTNSSSEEKPKSQNQNKTEEIPDFESIEEEVKEAKEQKEPKKRKKGRPPGSTKKKSKQESELPPLPEVDYEAEAKGMLLFVSSILGTRLGKKWKMTGGEIQSGSVALAGVLKKYGDVFGKYSVEIMFLSWAVGYAVPRLEIQESEK